MSNPLRYTNTPWGLRLELGEREVVNDDNYIQRIERLIEECRKAHAEKVMIIAHGARRQLSLFRMIEGIEQLRQLPFPIHVAVVSSELKKATDSNFMVTAAMNRGIRFSYHDTEQEALSHLLQPPTPPSAPPDGRDSASA